MREATRLQLARHLGRMAALVALGAGTVLVAWLLTEPPALLGAGPAVLLSAASIAVAAWASWALRQAWTFPRALARAEALWNAHGPAEGVEALLNGALAARGELGYRIHLLRQKALLAQGRTEEAWACGVHAELARLPVFLRVPVAARFARGREPQLAPIERWLPRVPRMAHLPHLAAAMLLRSGVPEDRRRGLAFLEESIPRGAEDPLLLEDAMQAALAAGEDDLAGHALALLLARHQDPRLRWDRAAATALLLRRGQVVEAAALAAGVPAADRTGPALWSLEAAARRRLGDLDGADAAIGEGLERHPGDVRLWLESHALAMEDRAYDDAYADLEEAARHLDGAEEVLRWEWELRRAEFAWWVDGDAETAREHLSRVPQDRQGPQVPPLRLHLRAALGEHAAVLIELDALGPDQAGNPDVQFLRAECQLGLQEWGAVETLLLGMGEEARRRPEFPHLRGLLCAHTDRLVQAREDLVQAAEQDPDNLRFLLDAGHACADLGEWERAESHWRQALRLDEGCEEALLELAEARLALHDRAGAIRYLRECLLHHPEGEEAQFRLAELESH